MHEPSDLNEAETASNEAIDVAGGKQPKRVVQPPVSPNPCTSEISTSSGSAAGRDAHHCCFVLCTSHHTRSGAADTHIQWHPSALFIHSAQLLRASVGGMACVKMSSLLLCTGQHLARETRPTVSALPRPNKLQGRVASPFLSLFLFLFHHMSVIPDSSRLVFVLLSFFSSCLVFGC